MTATIYTIMSLMNYGLVVYSKPKKEAEIHLEFANVERVEKNALC